ncbi:MAG: hypothetical protein ACREXN_03445 [Polaromonas sp.]
MTQAQALLFPGAKTFVAQPLKPSDEQRERVKVATGLRQRREEQKGLARRAARQAAGPVRR